MRLNPKQIKFCELYVKTGNATQSYMDAGYLASDVSVAQANSSRLLSNDMVIEHIKQIQAILRRDANIDTQVIIDKLVDIIFESALDVVEVDEDRKLKLVEGADLSRLAAISICETSSPCSNFKSISIKFQDKLKAIDLLCKILGFYEQRESNPSEIFKINAQRVLDTLRALKK